MDDGIAVLEVPTRWASIDPRIVSMLPELGWLERIAEHTVLEQRMVTRIIELVVRDIDPFDELDRLVGAIAAQQLTLSIDDGWLAAKARGFAMTARGDLLLSTYTLRFELEVEHDDVDLRDEVARYATFAPFAPLVELALFVTRVSYTRMRGRTPDGAFSIALDDETRHGVTAWLAAHEFVRDGNAWHRSGGGPLEHHVAFERAHELGVDEATAFVRAAPRVRARGTGDLQRAATAIEARASVDPYATPPEPELQPRRHLSSRV